MKSLGLFLCIVISCAYSQRIYRYIPGAMEYVTASTNYLWGQHRQPDMAMIQALTQAVIGSTFPDP